MLGGLEFADGVDVIWPSEKFHSNLKNIELDKN